MHTSIVKLWFDQSKVIGVFESVAAAFLYVRAYVDSRAYSLDCDHDTGFATFHSRAGIYSTMPVRCGACQCRLRSLTDAFSAYQLESFEKYGICADCRISALSATRLSVPNDARIESALVVDGIPYDVAATDGHIIVEPRTSDEAIRAFRAMAHEDYRGIVRE